MFYDAMNWFIVVTLTSVGYVFQIFACYRAFGIELHRYGL